MLHLRPLIVNLSEGIQSLTPLCIMQTQSLISSAESLFELYEEVGSVAIAYFDGNEALCACFFGSLTSWQHIPLYYPSLCCLGVLCRFFGCMLRRGFAYSSPCLCHSSSRSVCVKRSMFVFCLFWSDLLNCWDSVKWLCRLLSFAEESSGLLKC